MAASNQRRTYLVDPSFQLKYILLLMGWGVILAALLGAWTYQAHRQALASLTLDAAQRGILASADRELAWVLAGITLLASVMLGFFGFIITHRVAGPLYVMGRVLTVLADGRYPTRRALRKRDELQLFFAQFLDVVDILRERDERGLRRLESAIGSMRAALAQAPELRPALEELEADAARRRDALSAPYAHPGPTMAPAAARAAADPPRTAGR